MSFAFSRKAVAVSATLSLFLGLLVLPFVSAQSVGQAPQGIEATPYNSAAEIRWQPALGTSGAEAVSYEVHSGLFSVSEGLADAYDASAVATGTNSFLLENLTNGIRYYVAVKAVFAGGEKSAFSQELIVTPSSVYPTPSETMRNAADDSGEEDTVSPIVEEAVALRYNLVKVTFSEDVVLPGVLPGLSFTIVEKLDPSRQIDVETAYYKVDYRDEGSKELEHKDIVFVDLLEDLNPEEEYIMTVSAAVTDEAENPIESGVTDSAEFMGTDRMEIPEEEQELVTLLSDEPAPVVESPVVESDTTAPENVTNLTVTSQARENDYAVSVSWTGSTSDDVDHQDLYEKINAGTFDAGTQLGADVESYDTVRSPDQELTYKVTATDVEGNENSGNISSIRLPELPSTGAPFALIALGVSLSLGGIRRTFQKK